MGYHIDFTPNARKHLVALPRKIQEQIGRKIDALADNPRPGQSKRLMGADYLYRIRSGDYRIVYQVEEEVVTVLRHLQNPSWHGRLAHESRARCPCHIGHQ